MGATILQSLEIVTGDETVVFYVCNAHILFI